VGSLRRVGLGRARLDRATTTRLGRIRLRLGIVGERDAQRWRQHRGIEAGILHFGDWCRLRLLAGTAAALRLGYLTRRRFGYRRGTLFVIAVGVPCTTVVTRLFVAAARFITIAILALAAVARVGFTLRPVALTAILLALFALTLFTLTLFTGAGITVSIPIPARFAIAVALTAVVPLATLTLITIALPAIATRAIALVIVAPLIVVVVAAFVTATAITTPVFGDAGLFVGAHRFALEAEIVVLVEIVATTPLLLALILVPPPLVGQHAEIVIGELQIIFGVHAVTGHLRIARHVAVFLVQLGRVTTRAAVDPVAAVTLTAATTTAWLLLSTTTTATTAVLTIVDQAFCPSSCQRSGLKPKTALLPDIAVRRTPAQPSRTIRGDSSLSRPPDCSG
jgi:hypothetical protein